SLTLGFREGRPRSCETALGKGRRCQCKGQKRPQRLDNSFLGWPVGSRETTSGERNRGQRSGQRWSDCFDVGFRAGPYAHCGAAEKLRSHAIRSTELHPVMIQSILDSETDSVARLRLA